MTKRVLAAALWFYTGWYLGAEIAYVTSVSPALGPIVAVAAAMVVLYNPGRIMWQSIRAPRQSSTVHATNV